MPNPDITLHSTIMAFTTDQVSELQKPLLSAHVKSRDNGRGMSLSYIEGWHAIAEANRIFGFDNWNRETIELKLLNESTRTIGRDKRPGWGVTYMARVRIEVNGVVRDGCGAGHGIDADCGQAHESALKEAETDAMKRALMTFGNPFGLALYDRTQKNVSDEPPPANGNGSTNGNSEAYNDLWARLDKLNPLGQQALMICYEKAGIFNGKDFVKLMEYFKGNPDKVKASITDNAIEKLNEGKHPATGALLISNLISNATPFGE